MTLRAVAKLSATKAFCLNRTRSGCVKKQAAITFAGKRRLYDCCVCITQFARQVKTYLSHGSANQNAPVTGRFLWALSGRHCRLAWSQQFKNVFHSGFSNRNNQRIGGGCRILAESVAEFIQQQPDATGGIGGGQGAGLWVCRVGWQVTQRGRALIADHSADS